MAELETTYLTPTEVARMLMVSPITVRQWAQKGLLDARTTAGGHRRFLKEEVERFARERGVRLDDRQKTILVVDDDTQLNTYLVTLLQTQVEDLTVYSAADGFEAGRLVQQHKPEIVLLDIMMPGMDGVAVCRSIKSDPETAGALVVGMTGHFTPQVESRVLTAGAAVLLKKPFTSEELLENCGLASFQPALKHAKKA